MRVMPKKKFCLAYLDPSKTKEIMRRLPFDLLSLADRLLFWHRMTFEMGSIIVTHLIFSSCTWTVQLYAHIYSLLQLGMGDSGHTVCAMLWQSCPNFLDEKASGLIHKVLLGVACAVFT
jgi:hypothetical protein